MCPGAVPPFSFPFDGVRAYMDESLRRQGASINFNAVSYAWGSAAPTGACVSGGPRLLPHDLPKVTR